MRIQINLKEIYEASILAKEQKKSLLEVIYQNYLRIEETKYKSIKTSTNTLSYLKEKEEEINPNNIHSVYLLYSPLINDNVNLRLNEFILSI